MEASPNGYLIIFSAPSGAGKTTIVRHLLIQLPELSFSVSATTRSRRPNEVHGRDYYFLSPEAFQAHVDAGDFLEWEEVYAGTCYGTLRSEIERVFAQGKHVIFDVDVQGGLNIKRAWGERALAVFVQPPDVATLERRLRERTTETEEQIQRRMAKAQSELAFAGEFDYVLLNDELVRAKAEAESLVEGFVRGHGLPSARERALRSSVQPTEHERPAKHGV
jgi:guanylate kinase